MKCWLTPFEMGELLLATAVAPQVLFGQGFFPLTERGGASHKILQLVYHSTYICPNSLGRGEYRENEIFVSLKLKICDCPSIIPP